MADSQTLYAVSVVEGFFHSLGDKFGTVHLPASERRMFDVSERLAQRGPDGRRDRVYRGPTGGQLRSICATSPSRNEAVERLRQLVILGNDTTRDYARPSDVQLDEIVAKKVQELLAQKLDELLAGKVKVEEVARAAQMRVAPKRDQRIGIQSQKVRLNVAEYQRLYQERLDLWHKRCPILGIDGPLLTPKGRIDGRWERKAEKLWQQHSRGQPVTSGA
jgi:hypothetical protein